jgi:hypothetical protein
MSEIFKIASILSVPDIKSINLSTYTDFAGLEKFIYLENLKISNSSLRFLPSETLNLKRLKTLTADHNDFTDITSLPRNLELVDVSYNNISKLYIGKLNNLIELNVSNNRLLTLDNLSHLLSLKYLYCNSNLISSLHALNNLQLLELDISDNFIKNLEQIRPVFHSVQVICINNNPCCGLKSLQFFFSGFQAHPNFTFSRKPVTIDRSKLLKTLIPTSAITLPKSSCVTKAIIELNQIKQKNQTLENKIKKLEKNLTQDDINCLENRLLEIQSMSYEDWRSGLYRYMSLKALHAKRLKQLDYFKDLHPTKEHKVKFVKDKGRDFSVEQEKIAIKLQKLLSDL